MAYDEALAMRVRARIEAHPGFSERRMFGGIAFMIGGNMAVGVSGAALMVRVGSDAYTEALGRAGVRPFDMSGKLMTGWVLVASEGFTDDPTFDAWVDQGVAFATALPPKQGEASAQGPDHGVDGIEGR